MRKTLLFLALVLFFLHLSVPKTFASPACGVNIDPANPGAFPNPASVTGSGWVRMEFKDCTEDVDGEVNEGFTKTLAAYKGAISGYNGVGVGVVLILDYATYPSASTEIAKFAARAGKIAQEYAGMNIVFEIWNEPDLPGIFSLSASTYANMLNQTVPKIKGAGGKVITGGLGNGPGPYLDSVRAGAGGVWGQIDGVGIHPYGATPDPTPGSPCNLGGSFGSTLPDYLSWANGASGGKPLWITEFGWPTGNQTDQAKYITCFYQAAAGKVATSIIYTWSDSQGANWGLVSTTNSPKAGHAAYFGACGASAPATGANQGAISLSGGQCIQSLPPPETDRLTNPCYKNSLNYHPLRSDPFNPCDPLLIIRNELKFSCGSALTVNGSFDFPQVPVDQVEEVTQGRILDTKNIHNDDGTNSKEEFIYKCDTPAGDPTMLCAIRRIPYDVTFDFTGAQLPIIGSTQIAGLDDATLMNHYLSSYLNGTVQHAEQPPRPNYTTPEGIERVVNFSGPLKRLIPRYGLEKIKVTVANRATSDVHTTKDIMQGIFSNLPLSNQEDVMGETQVSVVPADQPDPGEGGKVIPYGYNITHLPKDNINRITLFIKKAPNPPIPYSDGRLYLPHLRDASGMAESLRNYALPYQKTPDDQTEQNVFRSLDTLPDCGGNQTAACKRLLATYDKNNHQGDTPDGSIAIAQYTWNEYNGLYGEVPTRNTVIIDNPIQLGEGVNRIRNQGKDVAKIVYAPRIFPNGVDNMALAPGPLGDAPDPECSLLIPDSPGDSITDKKGVQIHAKLTYTQIFRWKPLPPPLCPDKCSLVGVGCFDCGAQYNCEAQIDAKACGDCQTLYGNSPGTCTPLCNPTEGICVPKKISLPTKARVVLFNKTPLVDRIYEDLVSGFQSVLRRFLPGRTAELMPTNCSTGEYIKGEFVRPDTNPTSSCVRPATTTFASGTATGGSPSDNLPTHKSIADGAGNEPYTPSIIFPYLGSLQDYFLGCGKENLNLQNMLRPQGFKSSCGNTSGQSSPVSCPNMLPATFAKAGSCSTSFTGPINVAGEIMLGPDSSKGNSRMDNKLSSGRIIGIAEGETNSDPNYGADAQGPDENAPDFRTLYSGAKPEDMTTFYRVQPEYDKCVYRSNLAGFKRPAGTVINAPSSGYAFLGGNNVTIIYADCNEISLVYASIDGITFSGSPGPYVVHIIGIQVDQALVNAYNTARKTFLTDRKLPVIPGGTRIGISTDSEFQVGVRDSGTLLDLRSRADWW